MGIVGANLEDQLKPLPDAVRAVSEAVAAGERAVTALVEALGPQKVNLIGIPGSLPLETMQRLGVGRVSYGPWSQNVALTALQELVEDVHQGGGIPSTMRILN